MTRRVAPLHDAVEAVVERIVVRRGRASLPPRDRRSIKVSAFASSDARSASGGRRRNPALAPQLPGPATHGGVEGVAAGGGGRQARRSSPVRPVTDLRTPPDAPTESGLVAISTPLLGVGHERVLRRRHRGRRPEGTGRLHDRESRGDDPQLFGSCPPLPGRLCPMSSSIVIGFGLGFLVALQLGPISLLLIRSTLRSGATVGLAIGAGVAIIDALYASLGAAGRHPCCPSIRCAWRSD